MTSRNRQTLSASSSSSFSSHQGEWSKGCNIAQLTNAVVRRIPYCSQEDWKNFVAHADKHDLDFMQDNLHNLAPRFHFYILWKEKNPKISELVDPFGFFGSPEFYGRKRQNTVSDILTDMKDDKLDMILKSIHDLQTQITQISSCLNQLSADLTVYSFKQQPPPVINLSSSSSSSSSQAPPVINLSSSSSQAPPVINLSSSSSPQAPPVINLSSSSSPQAPPVTQLSSSPSAVFTNCFEDNWDVGQINQ